MPTYQVVCAQCHEDRWPTLPERPERYVCPRCLMLPPGVRERRSAAAQKGRLRRPVPARRKISPHPDR